MYEGEVWGLTGCFLCQGSEDITLGNVCEFQEISLKSRRKDKNTYERK